MKTLMWLVVIFLWLTAMVLVLGVAGVITVNRSPGEVTMHVNLKTFELETRELADAGKQFLDRAEQILSRSNPPRCNCNKTTTDGSARAVAHSSPSSGPVG